MSTSFAEKIALVGGGADEREFEKAFAGIAYSAIRNKAPRLLDFMVGFQLVDRNEDRSKAMGAFGFRVGKRWLMAPVFFLNGEIKGHEVLYVKDHDSCVPLKENWVNYIISQEPHEVGEPSGVTNVRQLGGSRPNLRTLSIVPSNAFSKWGASWLDQFKPFLAAHAVKSAAVFYPEVGHRKLAYDAVVADPFGAVLASDDRRSLFDLNQYVTRDFNAFRTVYDVSQRFPIVKAALDRFYGEDCLQRWAGDLLAYTRRERTNILDGERPKPKLGTDSLLVDPVVDDPVKSGAVRIYYAHSVMSRDFPELSSDEKETLLRGGVFVRDKRNEKQVSRIFTERSRSHLATPRQTGLYDVLESDGTADKMLVVVNGILPESGQYGRLAVIRVSGDRHVWCSATPSTVIAEHEYPEDEWRKWYDSLPTVDELKAHEDFVVIGKNRSATPPLTVLDKLNENEYRVLVVPQCTGPSDKGMSFERWDSHSRSNHDSFRLNLMPKSYVSDRIRRAGDALQVPRGCKVLKLSAPRQLSSPSYSLFDKIDEGEGEGSTRAISLGASVDIDKLIYTKTASLGLRKQGSDYYLRSQAHGEERHSWAETLESLIYDHGLSADDAKHLIKSASTTPTVYRVLYADSFGVEKKAFMLRQDQRFTMPSPSDQDMISSLSLSPRTAVNVRQRFDIAQPVPELSASQNDMSQFDMWQNYMAEDFNKVMQVAQVAAQRNQKEVFDVSMFTGIVKTMSQSSIVDRHLPAFMRALDSFGQVLLSFYWHSQEFADRYGKSDLPELEDSLRNAFDAVGEVTLFLKEKTVESPFGKGDINLDDSARI